MIPKFSKQKEEEEENEKERKKDTEKKERRRKTIVELPITTVLAMTPVYRDNADLKYPLQLCHRSLAASPLQRRRSRAERPLASALLLLASTSSVAHGRAID